MRDRARTTTAIDEASAAPQQPMRVLVVGATGGTGRAAVEQLLAAGHRVTAFSRSASKLAIDSPNLATLEGDATNPADVDRAVRGHDAVVVTLGITENPLRVRLMGSAGTPMDVRSVGTRHVIAAMRRHGVPRLVAQTSYGLGETRRNLRAIDRLVFRLLLKPQMDDTAVQEQEVRRSGVDWVLVQPVHLTDDPETTAPFVSTRGEVRDWSVSRGSVASFLRRAVSAPEFVHQAVALSGGGGA